jgi:hypothetical protein
MTLFSPEARKALAAAVTAVVGYAVTVGILDPGAAQTVVAAVSVLLNVVAVFYARNAV